MVVWLGAVGMVGEQAGYGVFDCGCGGFGGLVVEVTRLLAGSFDVTGFFCGLVVGAGGFGVDSEGEPVLEFFPR